MVLRTWLLIVAGTAVLAVFQLAGYCLSKDDEMTRIKRPAYGEGSLQEELEMEWREKNGTLRQEQILVEVGEKKLTDEEKDTIFHEAKEKIGTVILGNNESADYVDKPLVLPEKLEGLPVLINWYSSDPECVDWEGNLGESIPEEGKLLCLTAYIKLEEEEEMYFQYVRVFPLNLDAPDMVQRMIRDENENSESGWLTLPSILENQKVTWKKNDQSTGYAVMLLVMMCPFLLLAKDKQEAEEKKKLQRQQMMQDYPEILSKLTLLLSTGMNLRKAMERIGNDYETYKKKSECRKAYEVIVDICTEMDTGVSEREAYERLGERCGLLQYKTLSALLIQHLQKGSKGMEHMLEEETRKAQKTRQQQARILGEQASTKLLVPMILMLLVVFVILMVPAWLTFTL
ncbi:MAG: hypothetical protein EOM18_13400 [Clostridia bacterium]|nr:hypothetical protein [Clostridia bacterium]